MAASASSILIVLQSVLWLLLLLPVNMFYKDVLFNHTCMAIGGVISASLAITSILLVKIDKRSLQISITDILVICYTVYVLLNAYFISPHPVPDIFYLKLLVVFFIYFSVRLTYRKQRYAGLIIVAVQGVFETAFILLQYFGLLESKHLLFNFTGSFFNPGIAGGFIACSLCVLIFFFTEIQGLSKKIVIVSGIILLICALILTDSRAGWLAATIGGCFLLWHSENKQITYVKAKIKKSIILKITLFLIVFSGLFYVYQYKKASADGRLFIWKICTEMIEDKLLTGHGVEMFRGKYPYYQAHFFEKEPNSGYAMVAGDPSVPFNEYLSVLTSQGILGFAFLIAILLPLLIYAPSSSVLSKQKAFLITFCVFAFFSYPTSHLRMLVLLPFFIAILPSFNVVSVNNPKRFLKPMFIILLGVLYYSIQTMQEYSKLESSYKSGEQISEEQYNKIKYDITLLQNYYTFMADRLNSADEFTVIKDFVELYPSPNGLCELGRKYKVLNNFDQAEECFIFAANINPSLITPNYELFLLYQEYGDTKAMKSVGEKILKQPIKKEGTASIKIRTYVKNVLLEL